MADVEMNVNGEPVVLTVDDVDTLVDVLRDRLGLTGTVVGCGWGECGACSVLVDGHPVTACTTAATTLHGRRVVTVEGLEDGGRLHPVQEAFLRHRALQCGYCTPGMLIAAVAAIESHGSDLTESTVREAISRNFCRCTGYAGIIAAILDAAAQPFR